MPERESNETEPLWTVEQVAAHLQVAAGTVRQWVKLRKIPVVKLGGPSRGAQSRFRRADIDAWVESQARLAA